MDSSEYKNLMRCSSYCNGAKYNLDLTQKLLEQEQFELKRFDEVILFEKDGSSFQIFAFGCVVFWNCDQNFEYDMMDLLKKHLISPLSNPIDDYCKFSYGSENNIYEEEDLIILQDYNPLLKLSFGYALAQSVRLSAFEQEIDRTIDKTRYIPIELAKNGKISLSRKKISQSIGKLFAQKNTINLDTYVLDTPEFFWKRTSFEPVYHIAITYLDIKQRLEILNGKLNIIYELYQMLSDELKHYHSSFLEWIVISLIAIEVLFLIFRDLLKIL